MKKKRIGPALRKPSVILPVLAVLVIAALAIILTACGKKYSFEQVENQYFHIFNSAFQDPEDYEFHSLEAYCMEDDNLPGKVHYFIHAKFKGYIDIDEEWAEIEEVFYGDNGELEGFYCLSWDSIEGFEDINEQFDRAVKEGQKKTYSMQEIQELIDQNRSYE